MTNRHSRVTMGWLLRLVTGGPTGGRGPPTVQFYFKSEGRGPDLRKWRGPRMVALRLWTGTHRYTDRPLHILWYDVNGGSALFRQALFRQALFRQAVFQYGTIPPTRLFNYQFLILVYKQMFTVTSFALLPICWNYFVSTKSIRYFSIRHNQWRRKQFESGGPWRSPQRGPGAEPLVRGSAGRSPPKAERF